MDVSSEATLALLPVYLVNVLGATALQVGVIEGIAEATANIAKIFSGALSDRIGNRKLLTVLGYALAAVTKPVFPLAGSIGWVMAARFVDRIGKGVRDAPRDALVADLAPPDQRGAAYGLRQALDTAGALIGPLAAMLLMAWSGGRYRLVFWLAVLPAFAAVAIVALLVHEPAERNAAAKPKPRWADAKRLPPAFWRATAVAALLTLARCSEAFLILRAQSVGVPVALVPLVMVAMNAVYALGAYPAGRLSDRLGRHGMLAAGAACLIGADILLASGGGITTVMLGVALWGLHLALTQGLFASLVADTAPQDLRGTAFGVFNFASGIAMLAASVAAGGLWDRIGPSATFLADGALAALALAALLLTTRRPTPP